eukprot:scaffold17252_cov18-Tisochrysis_lutea.AAC.1
MALWCPRAGTCAEAFPEPCPTLGNQVHPVSRSHGPGMRTASPVLLPPLCCHTTLPRTLAGFSLSSRCGEMEEKG